MFTDYLMQWLEKKKNKVEATTCDGYYNTVVKHFIPYFKPLTLTIKELTPKHKLIIMILNFARDKRIEKRVV